MSKTTNLFLNGALLRSVHLAISVLTAFFLMPFVIHSLGDRWYGVWIIVGGLMGYYGLLDFGISSSVNRYVSIALGKRDYEEVNSILTNSVLIYSIISLISIVISIFLIIFSYKFVSEPHDIELLRKVLLIMCFDLTISFLLKAYISVLNAKLRYDLISYVGIGQTLTKAALIVYFIGSGYSIIALAIITFFVNISGYLLFSVIAKKIIPSLKIDITKISKAKMLEFVNYSKKTFLIQVGDMIRFKLDILVIAFFLGSALVTQYNIALQLHEYSGQLAASLIIGSLPVFARYYSQGDYHNLREKFLLLTRYSILISVTISGAVMILAHPFISIWMGEPYLTAIVPFLILRSLSFLGIGQNPSIQVMYAMGKHGFYARITIMEAVANLTLSLILVQSYGMIGVALGTAIPFFVVKLFVMPPYVCRQLKLSLKKYYGEMGRLVFVAGLCHIPFFILVTYVEINSYQGMFVSGVIYYLLYGWCLLRFLLPAADRNYLIEAVPMLRKVM